MAPVKLSIENAIAPGVIAPLSWEYAARASGHSATDALAVGLAIFTAPRR